MARPRSAEDVIKSYRYLRIGIIGSVVLLAASIFIEHLKTHCWQDSISSYYYTPVRAIFVGTLFAIGLSVIVYTARTAWEDFFLNLAGMFVFVVAVAPTMDVGSCSSAGPIPPPIVNGIVSNGVVQNIHNNVTSLLIVGVIGLVFAIIIAMATERSPWGPFRVGVETWLPVLIAGGVLGLVWWASKHWGAFNTRAHGVAAVAFFVFLGAAILAVAIERRSKHRRWFWGYLAVAGAMALGAVLAFTKVFGLFGLETYEIIAFTAYWIAQTVENWGETVSRPKISLSLQSGPPGLGLTVSGSGFEANEAVLVSYVHSHKRPERLVIAAGRSGAFTGIPVTIPMGATKGRHWVRGRGMASRLQTRTPFIVP